jgi:hypothetical protein
MVTRQPVASLQKPKPIITSKTATAGKEKKKRTIVRRKYVLIIYWCFIYNINLK